MADPTAQPSPFNSAGISGIQRFGAWSRVYDEFLRELQGPTGMKLYREAIDNCPVIGAMLFAVQHLSRNVTFRIEPAKGVGVDPQLAAKVAARVEGALFEDMEYTWPDQLSEILTMIPYGWALCEVTYKKCRGTDPTAAPFWQPIEGKATDGPTGQGAPTPAFTPSKFNDGWIGWKSWGLRSQDTLFMWEWSEDSRALVMQQMAPPDYRLRRIPLSKSLLFRTQVSKNSPEGKSSIRNAIPSYIFRKNIQTIEAIGIERDLAGYPVIQMADPDKAAGRLPPDVWNDKDPEMVQLLANMKRIVRSVRRDEQEGMVLPWWAKFSLMSSSSSRAFDTNAIINRYDQRISVVMLADFIMLGHEAVGSKALASTKSSLFTSALNSFLANISAIVNRFAIPQMLQLNGVPLELAPTLTHGDAENVPIEALGNYIGQLAKAGMPLFPDADLEEALLESAKLPTSGVTDAAVDPLTDDTGQLDAPQDASTDPQPDVAAEGAQAKIARAAILAMARQRAGARR